MGFLTNFKIVALPHTNTVISQGSYFNTSQSLGLLWLHKSSKYLTHGDTFYSAVALEKNDEKIGLKITNI